jgi:hypothetical protein
MTQRKADPCKKIAPVGRIDVQPSESPCPIQSKICLNRVMYFWNALRPFSIIATTMSGRLRTQRKMTRPDQTTPRMLPTARQSQRDNHNTAQICITSMKPTSRQ